MPSRRFHTKSQAGCKQCKARRVKCDFGSPCQHCIRRKERCSISSSYGSDIVSITTSSSSPSSYPSPASLTDIQRLSPSGTGITILGITGLEFRLLDHYYNVVAPATSASDRLRHMWQRDILHEGKTHRFLMHSILATSAYHLCNAYSNPSDSDQESPEDGISVYVGPSRHSPPGHFEWQAQQSDRYERYALKQKHLALQSYIPSLQSMTRDNRDALIAASALLSLSAVASTQSRHCSATLQPRVSSPIDDCLEISTLIRGTTAVSMVATEADITVRDGMLKPLLVHRHYEIDDGGVERDVPTRIKDWVSPHTLSALDNLSLIIDRFTTKPMDKLLLQAGVWHLKIAFAIIAANPEHESVSMVWPGLLEGEFFPLVKRRQPMALVLLAYWSVQVQSFQARWWIGGLGTAILRHIVEILTPLGEMTDDTHDDRVREVDSTSTHAPNGRPDWMNDPMAQGITWRDLLDWPLRECGIVDL